MFCGKRLRAFSLAGSLSLSFSLFALLCLGLGAGAVLPSRAGALPHPSFGMDGLGLYRTVCLLFEGEFPLRVGSEAPDLANT